MSVQGNSAPSNTQHGEAAPKPQVGAIPERPQTHIRAGRSHTAGSSGESRGSLGRESQSQRREGEEKRLRHSSAPRPLLPHPAAHPPGTHRGTLSPTSSFGTSDTGWTLGRREKQVINTNGSCSVPALGP